MKLKPKIYLPTPLQCALLPIITIFLLASANMQLIRERLNANAVGHEAVTTYMSTIGKFLDSNFVSAIGVFVFWLFVGTAAYAIIGMMVLVIHPLISMAHVSQSVGHQSAKTLQNTKHLLLTRFILRTIAAAGLVTWLAANITFVLRIIDGAATEFISNGSVVMAVCALVAGTIDLFILLVFTRLLLLRPRLF